jgi:hypothetical protein
VGRSAKNHPLPVGDFYIKNPITSYNRGMPQTAPVLHEIEVNIARLLGAALTLMAQTPFFLHQPLPTVSAEEFTEALSGLEVRNHSVVLNASLGEGALKIMQHNASRITQLRVLWRVVGHLALSKELLQDAERERVVGLLGPTADAIFLLGTRILSYRMEQDSPEVPLMEYLTWELLMVEGTLQSAQEQLGITQQLSRDGRRYTRATLWAFQVARDALLIVGSR